MTNERQNCLLLLGRAVIGSTITVNFSVVVMVIDKTIAIQAIVSMAEIGIFGGL